MKTTITNEVLNFHVSMDGDDTWTGRTPFAGSAGAGPFATLHRARQAIREWKKQSGGRSSSPVCVTIQPGRYELHEELVLTPEDSGSAECPVTWRGGHGGKVILSGGRRLAGLARGEHAGHPCWRIRLDEVARGEWRFEQIFVNGARRFRPMLPKEGYYRFEDCPEGKHPFWHRVGSGQFFAGDIPDLERPDEVELITYQMWFTNHLRIRELDFEKRLVHFKTRGWHTLYDGAKPCRYRLLNVKEAFSEEGEWYLDEENGELTYLPTCFEELGFKEVPPEIIAPRLSTLLRLEGSQEPDGQKVEHVRFENISFQHAEWRQPVGNPGAIQSAFTVPGAIQLRGAVDCAFYACEVAHIGQYGIEILRGSHRTRIVACHLHDLGAGGIKINHESQLTPHPETNDTAFEGMDSVAMGWGPLHRDGGGWPRPGIDRVPGGFHSITDCHIHHGGAIFPSGCGIWIGDNGYNTVSHNHIHHMNYSGISVGWNWWYAPAFAMSNRIEFNHLHDITCSDLLHDLSAIYLLGRQPGTVVRGNVVEAVQCGGYGGNCIYPDQGSSFMRIEGNLMLGAPYCTVGGNNAESLVIRGNLIYGRPGQVALIQENSATSRLSYIVEGNVFLTAGPVIIASAVDNKVFRNNLYGHVEGRGCRFEGRDFAAWTATGIDSGSHEVDPGVLDIGGGSEIRLRADSPLGEYADLLGLPNRVGPRRFPGGVMPDTLCEWPHHEQVVPTQLLVPTLSLGDPEPLDRAVEREPAFLTVAVGELPPFSFQVHNVGLLRSKGRARVELQPPEAGELEGGLVLDYDLAPGEATAITFHLTLKASSSDEPILLVAVPEQGNPLPKIGRVLKRAIPPDPTV